MREEYAGLIMTILLFPIMIFCGAWLDAWAIRIMWNMFIQPEYGGAPSLSVTLGTMLILRTITHQIQDCKEEKKSVWEILGAAMVYAFLRQPMAVAIAWMIWKVLL